LRHRAAPRISVDGRQIPVRSTRSRISTSRTASPIAARLACISPIRRLGRELQAIARRCRRSESRTLSSQLSSAVAWSPPSIARPALCSVKVDAVAQRAARPAALAAGASSEWRRRYWLAEPIELPSGSKIEVNATPHGLDTELAGLSRSILFNRSTSFPNNGLRAAGSIGPGLLAFDVLTLCG
jgi:hypothetical protein